MLSLSLKLRVEFEIRIQNIIFIFLNMVRHWYVDFLESDPNVIWSLVINVVDMLAHHYSQIGKPSVRNVGRKMRMEACDFPPLSRQRTISNKPLLVKNLIELKYLLILFYG